MKNKKIISRVLAIFAVLVLMVSMALPAFADEESDNLAIWEEFYYTYNPNYGNLAFADMYADDFGYLTVQSCTDFYLFTFRPSDITNIYGVFNAFFGNDNQYNNEIYVGDGYGNIVIVQDGFRTGLAFTEFSVVVNTDVYLEFIFSDYHGDVVLDVYYVYDEQSRTLILDEVYSGVYDSTYNDAVSIEVAYAVLGDSLVMADDTVRTLTDDNFVRLSPQGFYDGMYLSNRPDGVVPPSRTGMFGQLYYILYEAIYGADAVIGTTQDFILTQIATWMTFAVVLLPILVVAIFLWRVFAR